jgi:hypothetical protein
MTVPRVVVEGDHLPADEVGPFVVMPRAPRFVAPSSPAEPVPDLTGEELRFLLWHRARYLRKRAAAHLARFLAALIRPAIARAHLAALKALWWSVEARSFSPPGPAARLLCSLYGSPTRLRPAVRGGAARAIVRRGEATRAPG